jgi:epoxyqueuosine reductase QueG
MDQSTYEQFFGGTPMTRAKREGLQRNALIAMAVTSDSHLANVLAHARSSEFEVVRRTAEAIMAKFPRAAVT